MTSEVFNGRRFGAWFKYDITQLWRSQMKAALGIGLSGLILYALIVSYNLITGQGWCGPSGQGRVIVFVFALLVLELRQTRTYGFLTEKSQGSAWLMTPASTLEKWTAIIINTLIIIPVLFFVVYFGVDWLLCTVDHSCGTAMISTFWNAFTDYKAATEGGAAYIGVGSAIWLLIASFCVNFLYFLLCGLCFKKHKILYGLAITFALSMIFSLIFGQVFGMDMDASNYMVDGAKAAQSAVTWFSVVTTILAVGLAGGIYYRLKTIKH